MSFAYFWGFTCLTVGTVGEAALALYYKSEQSLAYHACNKPARSGK